MTTRLRLLAIVVFVLADIVLVYLTISYLNDDPPEVDLPKAAATVTPAPAVPESGQQPYEPDLVASHTVSLADDQTVLVARRGACAGAPPELTVSPNGGVTAQVSDTGLAEIMAVRAESRSRLRVVGADADCNVRRLISDDGGATWGDDDDEDIWFTSPSNPQEVVSPDQASQPGCVVTSLSQVGTDFARVSCADGTVRGTGNGGAEWLELGRLDNVRVMEFTTFNAGSALAVFQGCAAQSFSTRDGGRTWAQGGCITGDPAQAIAANGTGFIARVGDHSFVSVDEGDTWRQP